MAVNIQMNMGDIMSGEKIDELTKYIIDKFAEEKLSTEKAKIVINNVMMLIGETNVIKEM